MCDRAYLAPLVTTVYFCGVMLGGVIFGGLSDRLGRKWVMLLCLYSQVRLYTTIGGTKFVLFTDTECMSQQLILSRYYAIHN